jgi:hypothetical protein
MFLTEFQVTKLVWIYLILLITSAALILSKNDWTFKDKLLRLLLLFLLPGLGMLILAFELLIKKITDLMTKKRLLKA